MCDTTFCLSLMIRLCHCFFLSRRRRHTSCALVTGVQTCALPIGWHRCRTGTPNRNLHPLLRRSVNAMTRDIKDLIVALDIGTSKVVAVVARSEARRVGKECVSTCRYRWSAYPSNKKDI